MLRYTMFVRCCVWNRGPWSASLQHQLAQQAASFPCRLLLFVSKWHRKESIVRFLCCDRPYGGGASIWDLVRCSLDNVVLIGFYVRWLRSYSSSWRHLSTFPSGGIFPNFPFRVFPAGRNLLPVVSASCKSIVSVLTHSSIHRWRNEEIKKKKKNFLSLVAGHNSRAQAWCQCITPMYSILLGPSHLFASNRWRDQQQTRRHICRKSAVELEIHSQWGSLTQNSKARLQQHPLRAWSRLERWYVLHPLPLVTKLHTLLNQQTAGPWWSKWTCQQSFLSQTVYLLHLAMSGLCLTSGTVWLADVRISGGAEMIVKKAFFQAKEYRKESIPEKKEKYWKRKI